MEFAPCLLVVVLMVTPILGLWFTSEPEDLVAVHFRPVWWHCQAVGWQTVAYGWKFGGLDLATNNDHTIYSNGTLFIAKLTNNDVGTYSCTATSGGESISSREITLELAYIAPSFTTHPDGQNVFLEDYVTLHCYIESLPAAQISWTLDGSTISLTTVTKEMSGASTLTLSPMMYNNAGVYKCLGRNALLDVTRFSNTAELIVEGAPVFSHTLQPVFVPIAFTAVFDCRFHGNPSPMVTWFVHTINEDGNVASTEIVSSDKYSVHNNGTFLVYDITVDDGAFYTCRVDNMYGEMSESALLTVTGNATSPEFTVTPDNVTVTEGSDVTLTCRARGNPTPRVRWAQGERTVVSDHVTQTSDGQLVILSIQRDDGGYITCVWENEVGLISYTVYVNVQYLPIFTVEPQAVLVLLGSTVSMLCSAVGNPEPKIAWESPNSELYTSSSVGGRIAVAGNGTLTIYTAELEDHGLFTCIATNDLGASSVSSAVRVEVPPKFKRLPRSQAVLVNERVMFHCQATGSPPPTMTWVKDGEGWIGTTRDHQIYFNNTLVIYSAQPRDSGAYRCFAENNRGQIQSIAALTVLVPPSFTVTPRNQTTRVGSTVHLHCVTDGDPVPSQRWKKNGRSFQLDSNMKVLANDTLTIWAIRDAQFGLYECVATNQAGTISVSVAVEMDDLPVITSAPQNTTVNVTETLTLYCHGDAEEAPSVVWYRIVSGEATLLDDNLARVTVTDGYLKLQNVGQSDEGWYMCSIQNSVGDVMVDAFVNVQVPPTITHTNSPQTTAGQSTVTLTCQSSGDPAPSLHWIGPHGQLITGNSAYIVTDHTLQIVSANESIDGGKWTCRVCNVLGCYEELIQLNIEGVPVIVGFHGDQTNSTTTLDCIVAGLPVPMVTFISKGHTVTSWLEGHSVDGNTLEVDNGARLGEYTCMARNRHGAAEVTVTVPSAVSNLRIIGISSREVTITWMAPEQLGGLPLIGYAVGCVSDDFSPWQQGIFRDSMAVVEGLTPYTDYRFHVAATNILGTGAFSDPTGTLKTLADAPSAPTDLLVMKTGNDGIRLAWQQPEFINGEIDDIVYRYLLQSTNTNDNGDPTTNGVDDVASGELRSNDTLEAVVEGLTEYLKYRVTVWAVNVKLNQSSEPVRSDVDFTVEAPYISNHSQVSLLSIVFGILGGIAAILIVIFVVSHVRQNKRTMSLSFIKTQPSLDQFYMEKPKNLYVKKDKTSVKRLSVHTFYKFENDDSFHSNSYLSDDNGQSPNGKENEPDVLLMAKIPLSSPTSSSPLRTAENWCQSRELSELEIPECIMQPQYAQQSLDSEVAGNDVRDALHDGTTGHVTDSSAGHLLNDMCRSSTPRPPDKTNSNHRPSQLPIISGKASNSTSQRSKPVRVISTEQLRGEPQNKSTNNHGHGISSHTSNHPKESFSKVAVLHPDSHNTRNKAVTFTEPEYSKDSSRSSTPSSSLFTEECLIKSIEIPESSLDDRKQSNKLSNGVNRTKDDAQLDPSWVIVPESDSNDSVRGKAVRIEPVDLKVTYDSIDNDAAEETWSAQLY